MLYHHCPAGQAPLMTRRQAKDRSKRPNRLGFKDGNRILISPETPMRRGKQILIFFQMVNIALRISSKDINAEQDFEVEANDLRMALK